MHGHHMHPKINHTESAYESNIASKCCFAETPPLPGLGMPPASLFAFTELLAITITTHKTMCVIWGAAAVTGPSPFSSRHSTFSLYWPGPGNSAVLLWQTDTQSEPTAQLVHAGIGPLAANLCNKDAGALNWGSIREHRINTHVCNGSRVTQATQPCWPEHNCME